MAPLIAHLVIGERVFAQLQQFGDEGYGPFLLGCVLVDVHGFGDMDRHATHFAGRLDEGGVDAFDQSCANFLGQLDNLLLHPWSELAEVERAFVAGYLCHLAADEDWKRFGWDMLRALGASSWTDLPVPGNVLLTVFSVLSSNMFVNYPSIVSALNDAAIPDVLAHVPQGAFQAMWDVVKEHVTNGRTAESYFEMLGRLGKTSAEIQAVRHEHELYWEDAVGLVGDLVRPRVQAMTQRSLEVMPRLWAAAGC